MLLRPPRISFEVTREWTRISAVRKYHLGPHSNASVYYSTLHNFCSLNTVIKQPNNRKICFRKSAIWTPLAKHNKSSPKDLQFKNLFCKPESFSHTLLLSFSALSVSFLLFIVSLPFSTTTSMRPRIYEILKRKHLPCISGSEFYTIKLGHDISYSFFHEVHKMKELCLPL